jgi:hypothetical protein
MNITKNEDRRYVLSAIIYALSGIVGNLGSLPFLSEVYASLVPYRYSIGRTTCVRMFGLARTYGRKKRSFGRYPYITVDTTLASA